MYKLTFIHVQLYCGHIQQLSISQAALCMDDSTNSACITDCCCKGGRLEWRSDVAFIMSCHCKPCDTVVSAAFGCGSIQQPPVAHLAMYASLVVALLAHLLLLYCHLSVYIQQQHLPHWHFPHSSRMLLCVHIRKTCGFTVRVVAINM